MNRCPEIRLLFGLIFIFAAYGCHQITEFRQASSSGVKLIRTSDFEVESTLSGLEGGRAICSLGNNEFLVTSTDGILYTIDSEQMTVTNSLVIGTPSFSDYGVISRSPINDRVFVLGPFGRIIEINTSDDEVEDEFHAGPSPVDLCICPGNENDMIVVDSEDGTVSRISASSHLLKDQFTLPSSLIPGSVSRSNILQDIFLVSSEDEYGIDCWCDAVGTFSPCCFIPTGSPSLYACCVGADSTICSINIDEDGQSCRVSFWRFFDSLGDVGIQGKYVAACKNPARGELYILTQMNSESVITVIDSNGFDLITSFTVDGYPVDMVTHRNGEYLLVLTGE